MHSKVAAFLAKYWRKLLLTATILAVIILAKKFGQDYQLLGLTAGNIVILMIKAHLFTGVIRQFGWRSIFGAGLGYTWAFGYYASCLVSNRPVDLNLWIGLTIVLQQGNLVTRLLIYRDIKRAAEAVFPERTAKLVYREVSMQIAAFRYFVTEKSNINPKAHKKVLLIAAALSLVCFAGSAALFALEALLMLQIGLLYLNFYFVTLALGAIVISARCGIEKTSRGYLVTTPLEIIELAHSDIAHIEDTCEQSRCKTSAKLSPFIKVQQSITLSREIELPLLFGDRIISKFSV